MNASEISDSLLRLIVFIAAAGSAPWWRRWAGGRKRTFFAILGGIGLLFLGECLQLGHRLTAEAAEGLPLPWPIIYTQATGYIVVLLGFMLWLQDVSMAKRDAASRLEDERRRLQEVRLNEAKLRAILDCASEYCIIVADLEGTVKSYSAGSEAVLGWAPEEVVGKMRPDEFFAGAGLKPDQIRARLRGAGSFEGEVDLVRKSGEVFPSLLTITELRDSDGESLGYVAIAKDITSIRRAQDELKRERDFVRGIIETSELFIVGVTLDGGRITMFNRGAERVSGLSHDEVLGRRVEEVLLPSDGPADFARWLDRTQPGSSDAVDRREAAIVTRSGERRIIAWTNTVCSDAAGGERQVVAFGYDMTDYRQMQESLEQAKSELEQVNLELRRVASTDFLTGLVNRRQASLQFDRELARCRRNFSFMGVIMVDLDRFKPVNDTHGHHAGDAVLAHVASLLKSRARATDIVARYGGEEFLLVLPEADLDDTVKVANALRRLVRDNPTKFGDLELPMRASFGVAVIPPGEEAGFKDIVGRADEALYAAKGLGGNRVVTWHQLHDGKVEPAIANSDAIRKIQDEVREITKANQAAVVEGLRKMVERLEGDSPYTSGHSLRVTDYAVAIARKMGLEDRDVATIERAGLLHDLGKAGIPSEILFKAGTLSLDDWALVMQHPAVSARIVADLPFAKREVPIIRHHHERPDGRGYPDGLSGDAIPLGARVLAVADAIDAMTSVRPYREALSLEETLQQLRDGSGKVFDEQVVGAALACASETDNWPLPIGRLEPAQAGVD